MRKFVFSFVVVTLELVLALLLSFLTNRWLCQRLILSKSDFFIKCINDLICCSSYLSNIAPAISECMRQNLLCEWCGMVLIENL